MMMTKTMMIEEQVVEKVKDADASHVVRFCISILECESRGLLFTM